MTDNKLNKERKSITIDPELIPITEKYGVDNDRSFSWIVNKALREFLEHESYI